jgi:6-phosphogluconolactonase (cycloisomerase 2 family)
LIQLYLVEYLPDSLKLTHVQSLSTFGDEIPPTNPVVPDPDGAQSAAAGECIVASNQRDIYITNRLTGNPEDSIVRFELLRDSSSEFRASLKFGDSISSFGVSPRMISLSTDEKFIFGTNQANGTGLLAYSRDSAGRLAAIETSKVDIAEFRDSPEQFGCEFVQQI